VTVEEVLVRLDGVRRNGRGWQARCPAHDDATPSLAVRLGDDGRILLHDFAGCTPEDVCSALGLGMSDLFADAAAAPKNGHASPPPRSDVRDLGPATAEQAQALVDDGRLRDAATLARIPARHVEAWGAEWILVPAISGGGKVWGVDGNGRIRRDGRSLTRRNVGPVSIVATPDLRDRADGAEPIERLYDLEGESDLLAWLDAGGVAAIASTGGASSTAGHERHGTWLRSLAREVAVLRDRDEAGRKGAEAAAAWWIAQGVPVRVVELPADVGEGGDARDYLRDVAGVADLDALADEADRREPKDAEVERIAQSVGRYPPGGGKSEAPEDDESQDAEPARVLAVRASSVQTRRVRWLWDGRIPLGKLAILDGNPGLGKSLVTTDLAARITRDGIMPDGAQGPTGAVVLVSYEDDPADTIVPRFRAAGGDLDRLYLADSIRDAEGALQPLDVPEHVSLLEGLVEAVGAALVVVDPLTAALSGDVRSGIDHHVRRALAPLRTMAERTGCAVLVVRHLNKATKTTDPLLRGGGSIGIIGAARAGLLIGADPEDPARRVLAVTKMNLAPDTQPSLGYRVVSDPELGVGALDWLGHCDHAARDLLSQEGEEQGALGEAVALLRELLAEGPVESREGERYLRDAGVSQRTLERARRKAGVVARPRVNGQRRRWWWELPERPRGEARA